MQSFDSMLSENALVFRRRGGCGRTSRDQREGPCETRQGAWQRACPPPWCKNRILSNITCSGRMPSPPPHFRRRDRPTASPSRDQPGRHLGREGSRQDRVIDCQPRSSGGFQFSDRLHDVQRVPGAMVRIDENGHAFKRATDSARLLDEFGQRHDDQVGCGQYGERGQGAGGYSRREPSHAEFEFQSFGGFDYRTAKSLADR